MNGGTVKNGINKDGTQIYNLQISKNNNDSPKNNDYYSNKSYAIAG